MVIEQLAHRGIRDARVLGAMGLVPRHRFVDAEPGARPTTIGRCRSATGRRSRSRTWWRAPPSSPRPRPSDRALEVGAGSGYQAAVLARLCAEVFAVEIVPALAEPRAPRCSPSARRRQRDARSFDGGGGWPAHAPYDVIIVSAGAPRVPPLLVERARRRRAAGDPARRPRGADAGARPPERRRLHDLVRHALPLRRPARPIRRRWRRAGGVRRLGGGCAVAAAARACSGSPPAPPRARRCIRRTRPGPGTSSPRARRWSSSPTRRRPGRGHPGAQRARARRGREAGDADLRPGRYACRTSGAPAAG